MIVRSSSIVVTLYYVLTKNEATFYLFPKLYNLPICNQCFLPKSVYSSRSVGYLYKKLKFFDTHFCILSNLLVEEGLKLVFLSIRESTFSLLLNLYSRRGCKIDLLTSATFLVCVSERECLCVCNRSSYGRSKVFRGPRT